MPQLSRANSSRQLLQGLSGSGLRGDFCMAEHHTGPIETGAPMDYKEHEKTYNGFLLVARVGSAIIAALLIAMTAGFFGHAGLFGGFLIFVVLSIVGAFLAR
jgi:hypothetical protein